ncbi:type II toxin-antitoxin system HicA family toxin [Candidatus Micrarchaeota archaeon]|nr:type II toxin-antitoxin system HicA family toxin [Candidatus Micrarchaeota archaeon]
MGKHKHVRPSESPKEGQGAPEARHSSIPAEAEHIRRTGRKSRTGSIRLPRLKLREFISLMGKLGYEVVDKRRHFKLAAEGRPPITVPNDREVAVGNLRDIITKHLGWTKEEFVRFYEENK